MTSTERESRMAEDHAQKRNRLELHQPLITKKNQPRRPRQTLEVLAPTARRKTAFFVTTHERRLGDAVGMLSSCGLGELAFVSGARTRKCTATRLKNTSCPLYRYVLRDGNGRVSGTSEFVVSARWSVGPSGSGYDNISQGAGSDRCRASSAFPILESDREPLGSTCACCVSRRERVHEQERLEIRKYE
uniref:AlNc14C16G1734 protein n=1 Tax=Albugo laibachii Nc14 TaxID=890382 RepID=F0W451_9STRA|nr:AlNc14C16G1734 [Albugo laibachii Nc14]|eukprot:CCA15849.1 AlNc14C16G1734 [Albugo laibachii Nc14]